MKKTLRREKGNEFCDMQVNLRDGRLSITGTQGTILTTSQAKAEAIQYWESFLEETLRESDSVFSKLVERHRVSSIKEAAEKIIETDGEFHGLDVVRTDEDKVYLAQTCGQIREALTDWFPECVPYFKWHLNDMHPGCVHQEAKGNREACYHEECVKDNGGYPYNYGSRWLIRKLPTEVVEWVENLKE